MPQVSQQQYDEIMAAAQKAGMPPPTDLTVAAPVQAPVQAPVGAPQAQPTVQAPAVAPPQDSWVGGFMQDYRQTAQAMNQTGTLSKQLLDVIPDLGAMGGTMAGMQMGARAGATTGNPYAVATGGVIGAFLGAGAGESLRQLFVNEFDPLKIIREASINGIFEGAGPAVAKLFGDAATGLNNLRRNSELSVEEVKAVDELVKGLEAQGITLTPAQLTGSGLQQTLEKIGKAGFGGEAKFVELYKAQDEFIRDRLAHLVEQTGNPNRVQMGEVFQKALQDADDQLIEWAKPQFAKLDKAGRGVPVSLQSTIQTIDGKIAKAAKGRRDGADLRLDPEIEDLYRWVKGEVRNTNFENLFKTISKVTADQRKIMSRTTERNPTLEKAYVDVLDLLFKDAEKAAAKQGSEVLSQYKELTSIYKETKESLFDSAIKTAVDAQPEFAGEMIFRNGNVTSVKKAFEALDTAAVNARRTGKEFDAEAAKNNLRAGYLNELFTKTELAETSAEMALRTLDKISRDPKTKDTFEAMLDPKTAAQVKKVLGWGANLEKNSAGNFSLIVRGRQSGELNKLMNTFTTEGWGAGTMAIAAKSLSVLGAPAYLAKRAVAGKATNKYLKELQDTTVKFYKGDVTAGDLSGLFTMWAGSLTQGETVPPEFQIKGMNDREALEFHAARMKVIEQFEKAGMEVPPEFLEVPAKQ